MRTPRMSTTFAWPTSSRHTGFLAAWVRQYMIWSGGYTSTFISGAVPNLFDYLAIYKFLPITMLLLTVFAAARCTAAICGTQRSAAWVYLVGVGFTVLFLSFMQSVVMGFYWFNGAVTYQLANIILVGMITLIIRILDEDGDKALQTRRFIYLGLLIVLGIGCTETVMVEMFVLINAVGLWQIFVSRQRRRVWIALMALSVACFLVYTLSPGNLGRTSHIIDVYSDQHSGIQFWESLWASISLWLHRIAAPVDVSPACGGRQSLRLCCSPGTAGDLPPSAELIPSMYCSESRFACHCPQYCSFRGNSCNRVPRTRGHKMPSRLDFCSAGFVPGP